MAAIFGRIFGGGAASATDERFTVTTSAGAVKFSEEEVKIYDAIFRAVDNDSDGYVGGLEGAIFLRRSMLSDEDLGLVWKLACGGESSPSLSRDDFLLACKIVACKQSHHDLSLEDLVKHQGELLLADFRWGAEPDFTIAKAPEVADTDMLVSVSDPKQVRDNAVRSHVEYTVRMSSKLPQHAIKKASVERRYSDFEWLHARLGQTFPSCVIPELPIKLFSAFQDTAFRAKRREALETLLHVVSRHPIMSHSFDLYVFLTAAPKVFDAAKEYVSLAQATAEEEDGFLAKLLHGGGADDQMPSQEDPAFVRAVAYHDNIRSRLEQASSASHQYFVARRRECDELKNLGGTFIAMAQHESELESFVASQAALQKQDKEQRALDAGSREQTKAFQASKVSPSTADKGGSSSSAAGGAGGDGASGASHGGASDPSQALTKVDEDAMEAFATHKKSQSERVDAYSQDHAGDLFASPDGDDEGGLDAGPPEGYEEEGEDAVGAASGAGADGYLQAGFETKPGSAADLYVRIGSELSHAAHVERNGMDRLERLLGADLQDQVKQERMLADARYRHRLMLEQTERTYSLKSRRDRAHAVAMQKVDTDPGTVKEAERLRDKAARQLTKRQQDLGHIQQSLRREMRRVMMRRRVFVSHSVLEHVQLAQQLAGGRAAVWRKIAGMLAGASRGGAGAPDAGDSSLRVGAMLEKCQGAASMAVHRKHGLNGPEGIQLLEALGALKELDLEAQRAQGTAVPAPAPGPSAGAGGKEQEEGDATFVGSSSSSPSPAPASAADPAEGAGDAVGEASDAAVSAAGSGDAGGLDDEDLDGGGEI